MDNSIIGLLVPAPVVAKVKLTPEEKATAKVARDAEKAAAKAALEIANAEKAAAKAALKAAIANMEIPTIPESEKKDTAVKSILRTSSVIKPTKMVWIVAGKNPNAKRKDVIALCESMGIATHTARTQYQLWFSAGKPSPEESPVLSNQD